MTSVAVVLAAGGSSRLGRPKQLLDYRGEPLIIHATSVALGAGCDRTLVIWSAAAIPPLLIQFPVELIQNEEWQEGVSSSIRKAVKAAGRARILFTLSDQPLVTSQHLRALITSKSPIAATGYRKIAGVPAAFDSEFHDELMRLGGDRGARSVIEANHDRVHVIPFEDAAIDIDREEDYQKL